MKRILIMLSTYNGARYLEEQVDSIINQKVFYPVDILIRDDGSTDNSKNILYKLENKYKNIKVIYGKNKGVNASFFDLIYNAGDYDYYAFSDQDDIWLDDKIQTAVNYLEKEDNNIPLLYGSCSYITDENLNILGTTNKQVREMTLNNTIIQNFLPGHAQMMNKRLLDILKNEIDVSQIYMYDAWITNVAMVFGKVLFDNNPHTYYRQHSKNVIGFNKKNSLFSWIKERIKRIKNSEAKKYSKQIRYFYNLYADKMNENENKEIFLFLNYQNNIIQRIKFLFKSKLYRQKKFETFMFRLLYLFNGYKLEEGDR